VSRALDGNDGQAVRALALRSAAFVVGTSCAYALLLLSCMAALERLFFKDQFHELAPLTFLWALYYTLTGLSTIASSILRSAMQFSEIFWRQALTAVAAVGLLFGSLAFQELEALVIALTIIEIVSMCLLVHRLGSIVPFRSPSYDARSSLRA
jgi:O-antigen/teichoic acid export membrane protein